MSENNKSNYNEKITFLYNAISDAQNTIRSTDTKSGVVFVLGTAFMGGALKMMDTYNSIYITLPPTTKLVAKLGATTFFICLFIAVILSLRSINPFNNPNDHIDLGSWSEKPKLQYYLSGLRPTMRLEDYLWEMKDTRLQIPLDQYATTLESSESKDIFLSLNYELLKVSYIREKKIQRNKFALKWIEFCIWILGFTVLGLILTYKTQISFNWTFHQIDRGIISWLLVGHVIGDFLLQTNWQAENKQKIWRALVIHAVIYTTTVYLFSLISGGITLLTVGIIFLAHLLLDRGWFIDWWITKFKHGQTDNDKLRFMVDQSMHVLVLAMVSLIF